MVGPGFKFFKRKVRTKPGIVVMPASENLIFFVYDIQWLVTSLAEEVEKHSKLICLIMFHSFEDGGHDSFSLEIGPHIFTRRIRRDGATEQSQIIRNTACNLPVAADTLEKVRHAFVAD